MQEYDIPTISLRNTIYDETLRNKSALYEYFTHNPKGNMKDAEGLDLRHVSFLLPALPSCQSQRYPHLLTPRSMYGN